MPTKLLSFGIALSLSAGCGDEGNGGTAPSGPTPDVVGQPITYYAQPILSGTFTSLHPISTDQWVVAGPNGAHWVTTSSTTPLGSAAGLITAAALVDDLLLVASTRGLFVWQQDELRPSPLGQSGAISAVRKMSVTAQGDLWLAADNGLFVRQDGQLLRIQLEGSSPASPTVALGRDTLWVASGRELYALVRQGEQWTAERSNAPVTAVDLVADSSDRLWLLGTDGTVASRGGDRAWRVHDAVEGVTRMSGQAASSLVWFQTTDGIVRFDGDEFRMVQGISGQLVGAGREGIMVADSDGLHRYFAERRIEVLGLPAGEPLVEPTRLWIRLSEPASIRSVSIRIDDVPVTASRPKWAFEVDPANFADGSHRLEVVVEYDDGQRVEATAEFGVFVGPPPNWVDDIEPLFVQHCALCHNSQGSARVLEGSQSWIDLIDTILSFVRTGQMPLPPNPSLSLEEVERIEGWKAAGFPISRE